MTDPAVLVPILISIAALGGSCIMGLFTFAGFAVILGTYKQKVAGQESRVKVLEGKVDHNIADIAHVRQDTEVQREKISKLEGNDQELFRLNKDLDKSLGDINANLQVLANTSRTLGDQFTNEQKKQESFREAQLTQERRIMERLDKLEREK